MKIKDILEKKEFQDLNISDCIVLTLMYKFVEEFVSNEDMKEEFKLFIDSKIKELIDKDIKLR